jgi:hypothetical protein
MADQDKIDALVTQMELTGIGFSTVKDGKVMVISKAMLERMLAHVEKTGAEKFIVFIQDPSTTAAKKGRS